MTTPDVVPKKKTGPPAEETAAIELVRLAREQGPSRTGPDGLLEQFTESVLETVLNKEVTEHLGREKHRAPAGGTPRTSATAPPSNSTTPGPS